MGIAFRSRFLSKLSFIRWILQLVSERRVMIMVTKDLEVF